MNISYLDAADTEFQAAIDYYNTQSAGLGFEFSDEVKAAVARIRNYPKAWTPLSRRHSSLPGSSISLQHNLRITKRLNRYCRDSASSP